MSVISGTIGAVMGSDATEDAANTTATAQKDATAAQERIYAQMRADFEPYRQVGLESLPSLKSAVLGGTYKDASGKEVSFNPGASPAAAYQLEKGNTALQRSLAARGLAGSGYSASKTGDLAKSVAAADWQDQYNRLLDLIKIGTGASSATGSAASTLSNAYGNAATNIGNAATQAGAAKASLYSGLGAASANTAATGLRLYDYGANAGWWGGGAAAAGSSAGLAANYGAASNAAAGVGEYAAAV